MAVLRCKKVYAVWLLTGLLALPASHAEEPKTMTDVMRGIEAAMTALNAGMMRGDFRAVRASALRIARPPMVSSDKRLGFMESLGPYGQHVGGLGREMLQSAEALALRAEYRDMRGVTRRYTQLFQTCMDCHAFFQAVRVRRSPDRYGAQSQ